jgi:hypothetical protein
VEFYSLPSMFAWPVAAFIMDAVKTALMEV